MSGAFYLKETDGRAFIKPEFQAPDVNEQGLTFLMEGKRTLKEHEELFDLYLTGKKQEWSSEKQPPPLTVEVAVSRREDPFMYEEDSESVVLESPRYATENLGIFMLAPKLSFDSMNDFDDNKEASSQNLLEQVKETLQEFNKRFGVLKQKWTQTFLEVEESHTSVVKDLKILRDVTTHIKRGLGCPKEFGTDKSTTLWTVLNNRHKDIEGKFNNLNTKQDHANEVMGCITEVQHSLQQNLVEQAEDQELQNHALQQKLATYERKLELMEATNLEYERRFNAIFPILLDYKSNIRGNEIGSAGVTEQLATLTSKIQELESRVPPCSLLSTPFDEGRISGVKPPIDEIIQDIKAQLHIMNQRIVGGGVQIGTKVFQSFDDVQAWVTIELPCKRYGLFVDAVSLLDFFSFLGHTDNEKQLSAFHNQQRAGFATQYESRVATSIQNLFPHVFGKPGSEESQYLPAIPDSDKWDNGIHGLKHSIGKGMGLVESQVENAINTVLAPYPEARRIAQECLYKAKRFVTELCTFISEDFNNWKARGHGKKDAWKMTSVCVRRIFEEIHAERVIARDGYDHNDIQFTTSKILWATWKAHGVMEKYLKHQFYEHPSVAAVLARHLADNYVKPDDALSTKFTLLEKSVKLLTSQVERLNSIDKENRGGRAKQDKAKPLKPE